MSLQSTFRSAAVAALILVASLRPIALAAPSTEGQSEAPATVNMSSCAAAPAISPALLAATWPSLIGQRVTLDAVSVERAVGFTQSIVVARGVRFAVLMGPDQAWKGHARRTFMVIGSTNVMLHGRMSLPELLLDDAECES